MTNIFINIVKIFAIVVILIAVVLYIFLVLGIVNNLEFQENITAILKIIGAVIVASLLIITINYIGKNK